MASNRETRAPKKKSLHKNQKKRKKERKKILLSPVHLYRKEAKCTSGAPIKRLRGGVDSSRRSKSHLLHDIEEQILQREVRAGRGLKSWDWE